MHGVTILCENLYNRWRNFGGDDRINLTRELMSINEHWNAAPKSGRYTAVATLNSTNFPVEERADFVIP